MLAYTYSPQEESLARALARLLPEFQKRCYDACMESRQHRLQPVHQSFTQEEVARARAESEHFCRLAWLDAVKFHFPRSMLRVARERAGHGNVTKPWFIVELTSLADRLSGDEGWVMAAHTFEEATAFLAERCIERGFFPDNLEMDGTRLQLFLEGECVATVRPLDPVTSAKPDSLQRARSTMLRLRAHAESPLAVLLRRMQEWPGMSGLQMSERLGRSPSMTLPEPSEVLFSAGQLCRIAGVEDHSETLRQDVAAAILGVPTWNHFASGLGKAGATRLLAPWYIAGSDIPASGQSPVFADVFDAFAAYMEFARRITPRWDRIYFDGADSIGSHELPMYWLRESDEIAADARNLDLSPCVLVEPSGGAHETAVSACRQGVAGLRKLFQLDATAESRFELSQGYRGVSEVVRDGHWRFGFNSDADTFLEVSYLDAQGQVARRVLRKARKVQVAWFTDVSQNALVYVDAAKTEPFAVLKGVSAANVEKLKRELGRDAIFPHRSMIMEDLDAYYQRRLRELVDAEIPVFHL